MRIRISWFCLIILAAILCSTGCSAPSDRPASRSPVPPSPSGISVTTTLAAAAGMPVLNVDGLVPGSLLPDTCTCTGTSESPEVSWSGIPSGAKSLVLILDDPDAPSGTFTHWLVYNIPPAAGSFSRAQPDEKVLGNGARQGENSAGSRGYYPPCPPIGTTHRYIFQLYAVDREIVQPAADRRSIDSALDGHTLSTTEFVTSFRR